MLTDSNFWMRSSMTFYIAIYYILKPENWWNFDFNLPPPTPFIEILNIQFF